MAEALARLPGLRILGRLGHGGMGEVLLAEESDLGRRVAVKRLDRPGPNAEPEARRRFEREARTLAVLDHPHLVKVHRLGESEGRLFLVMELMEGGSLADRLRAEGPLPVAEALEIFRQALAGLNAAWARGIVHRDVKPSNLLFDREKRVRVADFGLARPVDDRAERVTRTGLVVGSPHYMAPEQIRGEALDLRSDVYSLGTVLFEMLAGRAPFEGRSQGAILAAQIAEPLPDLSQLRPDLPEALLRGVERLTAKEPADRPATADGILAAVSSARRAAGLADGAPPSTLHAPDPAGPRPEAETPRRPAASGRRRRALLGSLAAGFALGAGALVPVLRQGSPGAPDPAAAPAASATAAPSEEAFGSLGADPGAAGVELARALERRAGGTANLDSGGGSEVLVELGTPGRPLLFRIEPGGGIRLLHPAPGRAAASVPGGRPLRLAAPAAGAGGGWLVLVATEWPLEPPALLGARPAGSTALYPARVAGVSGAVHPAHEFLTWLAASLGSRSGPWTLTIRSAHPDSGPDRRPEADDPT